MTYTVKEMFYTLQGEGRQAGRAAVFCRFSGCNLWSGREADRAEAACPFCDTDFVGLDGAGGGRFATPEALATALAATWSGGDANRFVVFTGGEPLLQLDDDVLAAVHARGFTCAVETNGTRPAPAGLDWVCVSPKAGVALALTRGDELKLVFPQAGLDPASLESLAFDHFWLQPMDGTAQAANTRALARDGLDHRFLDDVRDLGPATMENLARWIWRVVAPHCHNLAKVSVYRDSSGDTCGYYGPTEPV